MELAKHVKGEVYVCSRFGCHVPGRSRLYTAFYQLKEEPFRLTPDPRFLHLADPHRTALKVLLQGVLQRKGFTVVAGPVGTGKTTLLHTALQILTEKSEGRGRLVSAFLVNPTLTPAELLEAVLDEYEITCNATSKPRRLAALHQMLFQTQQQGGTAVLLIDEAHLMNIELLEEIRLLGNTDTYQEKLLQIVLCGQPELFAVLQRPELQALQQRIAGTCLLRPLSLPETRAYIAERLHAAGLRGSSPFTGTAVENIHRLTNGVPRLINLLSDACLMVGFDLKRKQIDQLIVDQAAEDVLGLLKAPVLSPPRLPVSPESHGKHKGREARAEEKVAAPEKAAAAWTPAASAQTVAAAPPDMPTEFNSVAPSHQTATAVAVAESEEEVYPPPPKPGREARENARPTKSTFDVLIAALKQSRGTAREQ
jgi:type II secretory pathway predicted ATPase ExeA